MNMKISKGEKRFRVFNYILLTLLALVCLYPFWHVAMASFSDGGALMKHKGILLKPETFSLEAYGIVLSDKLVYSGFLNTFFLLIVGVSLQLLMTSMGAYFFSRPGVRFSRHIQLFCIFTMYISGGTIPMYLTIKDFHMTESLWGVVIPFMINTYNMIILRSAFEAVPESLNDSARIDGAGHYTILFKIILPLTKASIAVIGMYYGMSVWNAWFWAGTLISDEKKYPLQLVLRNMVITDNHGSDIQPLVLEPMKNAIIMISVIPILLVYPFIQKYFAKGVMIGAVKG